MPAKKKTSNQSPLKFEYVTSTVSLMVTVGGQADGIGVQVLNDSGVTERARIVFYVNTGAGAVMQADTGITSYPPSWQGGAGFTIPQSGEYWVRIQTSSEFVIPKVAFERYQSHSGIWIPIVSYAPGDFAVFVLKPSRKRLW